MTRAGCVQNIFRVSGSEALPHEQTVLKTLKVNIRSLKRLCRKTYPLSYRNKHNIHPLLLLFPPINELPSSLI